MTQALNDTPGGGDRRSRILQLGNDGGARRSAIVAAASTLVLFGAIAILVVQSPGWDEVKGRFFDQAILGETFPDLLSAFVTTLKLFLVAEAVVLVAGLVLAILRSLPGPVFFPVRLLGAIYSDIFRSIPPLLLVLMLGFGAPALQLGGVPKSPFFWGVTALALVYTSFVSEVYRAGIDSVHPSQDAAARSLGLSRMQSLRHVVLPQAVRRIIPPLLNDFIGLQKDTSLVAALGVVEVLRQAQIETSASFNYTPYIGAAILFLAITIPMTRLTDWLVARDRRRRQSSGAVG